MFLSPQTYSRLNDIFEAFLMQTQINGFEICKANDLRKMVVDYMVNNCDDFKVCLKCKLQCKQN